MQINQVNLSYVPVEDRLLMRINTLDKAVMSFWLTRAITTRLLNALGTAEQQALKEADRARYVGVPEEAVTQLNREAKAAPANFAAAWDEQASSYPLGETPLLVKELQMPQGPGKDAPLVFVCATGQTLTMTLNDVLLHSLITLVERFAGEATWGLQGKVVTAATPVTQTEASRHLH